MAANNRVDLSSFPKLKLNAQDVTTSWKHWLSQFEIAVELTTLNLGTVDDGHGHPIDVFRGRTKLLALLSSVGSEGMETLQSLGFDLQNNDINAYTIALDLLKGHYEREESRYVKTIKYVTVAQAIGEEERDYLLRVEKLSRTMEFGHANEQIRERFNVALAVNGLSDRHMRRMLLQENELTWANLTTKLRAKSLARESEVLEDTVIVVVMKGTIVIIVDLITVHVTLMNNVVNTDYLTVVTLFEKGIIYVITVVHHGTR